MKLTLEEKVTLPAPAKERMIWQTLLLEKLLLTCKGHTAVSANNNLQSDYRRAMTASTMPSFLTCESHKTRATASQDASADCSHHKGGGN